MSNHLDAVTDAERELARERDRAWLLILRGMLLRARTAQLLRRHRWKLLTFRRRLDELRVAKGIAVKRPAQPRKARRRTRQPWVRLVRP